MFSECSLERYEPSPSQDPELGTELDNSLPTRQGRGVEKLSDQDLDSGNKSRNATLENNLTDVPRPLMKSWLRQLPEMDAILMPALKEPQRLQQMQLDEEKDVLGCV